MHEIEQENIRARLRMAERLVLLVILVGLSDMELENTPDLRSRKRGGRSDRNSSRR